MVEVKLIREYMYIENEFNKQAVEDDLIGRAKRMNNLEEETLGDIQVTIGLIK